VVVKRPVAVVGVGQTKHATRRAELSIPGLVREAVDRALLDAGLEHKDIDAVVIGKAPTCSRASCSPSSFWSAPSAVT
jgi:acetyl-CoA C-acetyltransferase